MRMPQRLIRREGGKQDDETRAPISPPPYALLGRRFWVRFWVRRLTRFRPPKREPKPCYIFYCCDRGGAAQHWRTLFPASLFLQPSNPFFVDFCLFCWPNLNPCCVFHSFGGCSAVVGCGFHNFGGFDLVGVFRGPELAQWEFSRVFQPYFGYFFFLLFCWLPVFFFFLHFLESSPAVGWFFFVFLIFGSLDSR